MAIEKNNLLTYFNIKHLTPSRAGQLSPSWGGQGHWFSRVSLIRSSQKIAIHPNYFFKVPG
jgi:hypothetical protein